MPTVKEMRRLYKDHMNALSESFGRALTPVQLIFFQPEKPPEELYDTAADPHEVNNLASSLQHREVLERMRSALADWQKKTGDLGLIPESELRERMRPGGVWSVTAPPIFGEVNSGQGSSVTIKL